MREIVAHFLEERVQLVRKITEAIAAGQPADVERTAHALKGALATLSAPAAAAAAEILETMARRGEREWSTPFAVLQAELKHAVEAFERVLENRKAA
jgi:HPt (histidine-containing phosphotransfer) domain-containing protein